jgi:hypothetical protein
MIWNNRIAVVSGLNDRVEALKIAHTLIEAGLEASVDVLYSVSVPKDDDKSAQGIIYRKIEADALRRRDAI